MSDTEDNITPFRLPVDPLSPAKETFGERLRRRRDELVSGSEERVVSSWQSRARVLTALVIESPHAAATIVRM